MRIPKVDEWRRPRADQRLGPRENFQKAHGTLRSEYKALKLRLAAEFAQDKTAYTVAKGIFIRSAPGAAKVRA